MGTAVAQTEALYNKYCFSRQLWSLWFSHSVLNSLKVAAWIMCGYWWYRLSNYRLSLPSPETVQGVSRLWFVLASSEKPGEDWQLHLLKFIAYRYPLSLSLKPQTSCSQHFFHEVCFFFYLYLPTYWFAIKLGLWNQTDLSVFKTAFHTNRYRHGCDIWDQNTGKTEEQFI